MTINTQTYQAGLPAPHSGVVLRALGHIRNAWKAYRNRRQISMLAGFNEHMLRDIGLTSADVEFALQEPLWVDPSDHLVRTVDSRKRTRFRRSG